jgi:hypothetical protein
LCVWTCSKKKNSRPLPDERFGIKNPFTNIHPELFGAAAAILPFDEQPFPVHHKTTGLRVFEATFFLGPVIHGRTK